MKEVLEQISNKFKIHKGNGASADEVKAAEDQLGVAFPEEYVQYLRECGILSFGAHELFGLGVSGYLNVVEATEKERKIGRGLPAGCFVIENLRIDGVLIVMDAMGNVFLIQGDAKRQIASSFVAYLKSLIR